MTQTELAAIREKAEALLQQLKLQYPGQQVYKSEWLAGGIIVSVCWPFKREEITE